MTPGVPRTDFFPKHSNLKYDQRSFASYGCKVWNSLDRDVQAIEEPKRLVSSYKTEMHY